MAARDRLYRDFTDTGFAHPTFFKADGDDSKLFLGIELETEAVGPLEDLLDAILDSNTLHGKEFWKYKDDGSLTRGAECVTHPFSWRWYVEHMNVEPLFNKLENIASPWNSSGANTAGLHVHMSRKAFTPDHLARFIRFHYKNKELAQRIAGRKNPTYAKFTEEAFSGAVGAAGRTEYNYITNRYTHTAAKFADGDDVYDFAAKRPAGNAYDRYLAVNLCRPKTIELRYFRSTNNLGRFYGIIEWCFSLFEYTKNEMLPTEDGYAQFLIKNEATYPNALSMYRGDESHLPEKKEQRKAQRELVGDRAGVACGDELED